ncbi:MAG: trypsin-like peptidase domain-containing protein [Paracoccaceae bacterium]|nr:trypsin-like peptidase domain-containing protein [Paracoccaceae bacterium]
MKRFLGPLVVAFMMSLPAGALAQDNATLVSLGDTDNPEAWRAVGRLDAAMSGFCTATLIAPDLVLTAAHCVYSSRTKRLIKPAGLKFRAGLHRGVAVAESQVAQVEVHPGYDVRVGPTAQSVGHDVALLRLAKPIPTHVLNPFSVRSSTHTDGPVNVVSYGLGRAESLSHESGCEVFDGYKNVILMDCEATFGSSGAPVFSQAGEGGQIVSLVSSVGLFRGKKTTYGMILPKLVEDLKAQMRANSDRPVADAGAILSGDDRRSIVSESGAQFVLAEGS